MNFLDIFGQVLRDSIGMPTKVSSYNNRIKVYDEISSDISYVENSSVEYLDESGNIDWKLVEAKKIKLEYDLANGAISANDYVLLLNNLDVERKQLLDDFISFTDLYFITAYRNRLNSIKERYSRDSYISLMKFETWFDMEEARELANLASLQIKSSDKYIDAKKIAEIRDKYIYDRHMRRGR